MLTWNCHMKNFIFKYPTFWIKKDSKKIYDLFLAQNWTIQKTMIEWSFALSDLTNSFRYSHLGYKGIWVHKNNSSGTIESSGTKFSYT